MDIFASYELRKRNTDFLFRLSVRDVGSVLTEQEKREIGAWLDGVQNVLSEEYPALYERMA